MGFSNEAVGGTTLVRPAIQSPNFVHGSAGWTVNQDGSAEFNNLTLRGTFTGTNYVQNSSGLFFYSGTPASGNLVASISNVSGTDAYGNAYLAGVTSYTAAAGIGFVAAAESLGAITYYTAATMAGPWTSQGSIGLTLDHTGSNVVTKLAGANGNGPFINRLGFLTGENPSAAADETWHTAAAGSSWTGTIGYKITAENEVFLWSNTLTSPAASVNGVTIITLPSGYRPAHNMTFEVGQNVSGFGMRMTLATDGTLTSTGITASSGVQLGNRVPLDIPSGV